MEQFRIRRHFPRPSRELTLAMQTIPTAIVADAMDHLGLVCHELRPLNSAWHIAGPALTVRTKPGDNLAVHKSLELVHPGDVVVVDGGGNCDRALAGEILAAIALRRGVAALVIDGAVRDYVALSRGALPVWARGTSPLGPYKDGPGEINVPIAIGGGVLVRPGDIIVADADGIAVVPAEVAGKVLQRARQLLVKDEWNKSAALDGIIDRSWVDNYVEKKGVVYIDGDAE